MIRYLSSGITMPQGNAGVASLLENTELTATRHKGGVDSVTVLNPSRILVGVTTGGEKSYLAIWDCQGKYWYGFGVSRRGTLYPLGGLRRDQMQQELCRYLARPTVEMAPWASLSEYGFTLREGKWYHSQGWYTRSVLAQKADWPGGDASAISIREGVLLTFVDKSIRLIAVEDYGLAKLLVGQAKQATPVIIQLMPGVSRPFEGTGQD